MSHISCSCGVRTGKKSTAWTDGASTGEAWDQPLLFQKYMFFLAVNSAMQDQALGHGLCLNWFSIEPKNFFPLKYETRTRGNVSSPTPRPHCLPHPEANSWAAWNYCCSFLDTSPIHLHWPAPGGDGGPLLTPALGNPEGSVDPSALQFKCHCSDCTKVTSESFSGSPTGDKVTLKTST